MGANLKYEYKSFYGSNSSDEMNETMAAWANAGWTLHSAIPVPGSILMIWQRQQPESTTRDEPFE